MSLTSKYGMRGLIPEGEVGRWKVKHFTVSKEDADRDRVRAMVSFSSGGRCTPEGDYAGLFRGRDVIMSDTPDEIRDHLGFIRRARGDVLIHGLGLGMCAAAALQKEEVEHVTVVEVASEVIELVGLPLAEALGGEVVAESDYAFDVAPIQRTGLMIIRADALTWKPPVGACWDVIWHDIWDNMCLDNLEDMKRLHRRFGQRKLHWQGSWRRETLEDRRARERAWLDE